MYKTALMMDWAVPLLGEVQQQQKLTGIVATNLMPNRCLDPSALDQAPQDELYWGKHIAVTNRRQNLAEAKARHRIKISEGTTATMVQWNRLFNKTG